MDIMRKMGEGLGLENVSFEDWPCQFRINKYHFTPEAVGSSGVQIHTDSGFLTILQDDENVGGLEVMKKSGEFVAVDPWPNTLLVNLGDIGTVSMLLLYLVHFQDLTCSSYLMLLCILAFCYVKVWSNGRFYNVKHRVICKEAKIRWSIASFLLGPREIAVEPPPELVDAEHPRVYVPFTFQDYRKLRLSTKLQAGEALDLMRTNL